MALEFCYLQPMDDTIVFYEANEDFPMTLHAFIRWFELASRLHINYHKSELLGIIVDSQELTGLKYFGLQNEISPLLLLPICIGTPDQALWNPIIENSFRRLTFWSDKYSFVWRLHHSLKVHLRISSNVSSSSFKCPRYVIEAIWKIECGFCGGD